MQLVPRKILLDIMRHKHDVVFKDSSKLDEVEYDQTAFSSFMKKATETYDKANAKYNFKSVAMSVFTNNMYEFCKDNKNNIKYVDQGSSRMVFMLANGTALKMAMTEAGQAQNKQESKNCMHPYLKYEIFPDFYDADTKNWLALNCELCSHAEKADFARLLKIQPKNMSDVIEFIVQMKLEDWELDKAKKHYEENSLWVYSYFVQQLIDNKTPAIKAIKSLIDFYRKNGLDSLLLGDLESIENWGWTIRNGEQVLVVIDAGFNEDIYQNYYKTQK